MFEFMFLGWFLISFAGWLVGRGKGRPGLGFLLSFVFGAIGLVVIALMRPKTDWSGRVYGGRPPYGQVGGNYTRPYPGQPTSPYGGQPASPYGQPASAWTTPPADPPAAYDVTSAPAWRPDPSGRWDYRWWDGSEYTNYVSKSGVPYTDSLPI